MLEYRFPSLLNINIIFRQFRKEMMNLAVDQLRDEFKQIAIEGGRQGAQMILHGEGIAELQQELENMEQKLLKLKMEKKSWKMIFTVKKKRMMNWNCSLRKRKGK